MKRLKLGSVPGICLVACLLLAGMAILCLSSGIAEDEVTRYTENIWNYVDASMDVSGGIPEHVTGRLARIKSRGKLSVATEPYYPPQEFIDKTKSGQAQYVGSDMELARLIAERMGVELEIVPLEFTEVLTSVAEGKYDLAIAGLSFTSSRASVLEMSKGYYFNGEQASTGIVIREEDAGEIKGAEDLAERDIVAQRGTLQETMAAENILIYHKFQRLISTDDIYSALIDGRADAAVLDMKAARTYIDSHPDCGLMIMPDVFFELNEQYRGDRVAAEKGETELIAFVNGVIDEVLEDGTYERWYDEYTQYYAAQN